MTSCMRFIAAVLAGTCITKFTRFTAAPGDCGNKLTGN